MPASGLLGKLLDDDIDYPGDDDRVERRRRQPAGHCRRAGFRRAGRGAIVNTASVVAYIPERFNGIYSATKALVLNLTQAIHSGKSRKRASGFRRSCRV